MRKLTFWGSVASIIGLVVAFVSMQGIPESIMTIGDKSPAINNPGGNVNINYSNSKPTLPQEVLMSRGVRWSDEEFKMAIRNAELEHIELFLKGGKKPAKFVSTVLGNEDDKTYDILKLFIKYGLDVNKKIDDIRSESGTTMLEKIVKDSIWRSSSYGIVRMHGELMFNYIETPSSYNAKLVNILRELGAKTTGAIELVEQKLDEIEYRIKNPHPCFVYVASGRDVPFKIIKKRGRGESKEFFFELLETRVVSISKKNTKRLQGAWRQYCYKYFIHIKGKKITLDSMVNELKESKKPYYDILASLK